MRRNQKLTNVIGGRTVQGATAEQGKLVIKFNNQSTMQVKTGRIANTLPPGGKVKVVQEDGPELRIQFEDDSTVTFQLANPGSSVAVRDKNNQVEYLG
jgi:hypothetical protein